MTKAHLFARCPDCPTTLGIAREGDRIVHVGPVLRDWPHGEHEYIPEGADEGYIEGQSLPVSAEEERS